MNALQPSLQGQSAYNFKPLSGPGALNVQNYGATGGLSPQSSTYNYNPAQVKSTLDNSQFTQDYFNKGISAPLLRTFDQSIAPRINDAAASAGNTFSTRTQFSKQQALGDLQTQMAAQLSSAVRQDQIEKSQQDLNAQQFNVNSGMQNAQFGAGQNLDYSKLNSANTQFLDQLNSQNQLQAGALNNQTRLAYDTLNTNTGVQLGENARQNQLQAALAAQGLTQGVYQNALMGEQLAQPLQQYRQQGVQDAYAQWQNAQPYNNPWIKLGLGVAGLNPDTIATQNPTGFQQAGQALGLLGAGSSFLNSGALGSFGGALDAGGYATAGSGLLGGLGSAAGAVGSGLGAIGSGIGSAASGAGSALWGLLALL